LPFSERLPLSTRQIREIRTGAVFQFNLYFRDNDIERSIKRTASVGDYFKTYGLFYISKTSQNYANTIEALANFDKSKVL